MVSPAETLERTQHNMTRLTIILSATAVAVAGVAAVPTPALAQQANTSEVTVYGNDPCPRSTDSSVYVCNRRPETERYRLPPSQQLQGTRQQRESWANKSQAVMSAGRTGVGSCSAVGPAGSTGCLMQDINNARQSNAEAQDQNSPPQ